jgi:RNA polymerase sigma-70 factor (ECF subfamily)
MVGICHHTLQEWYRQPRPEPLDGAHENIPTPSNIEEEFINEETAAGVRLVIGLLPERDAAILRAVFLGEESKDEVCRRLGIERKYLRVLLHRAKERFKAEYRRKRKPPFFP